MQETGASDEVTRRSRSGWSLPLHLDGSGRMTTGRRQPLLDSARLVLEVVPGERPLLPEFGCRIHHLEALKSERERQLAAALVEEALERWTPWLGVERVEVLEAAAGDSVRLALRVRGSWHEMKLTLQRRREGTE